MWLPQARQEWKHSSSWYYSWPRNKCILFVSPAVFYQLKKKRQLLIFRILSKYLLIQLIYKYIMELRGEWWEVLVCWGESLIFYQTTRAKENLECFQYCSETGGGSLEAIAVSAHSPAWLWRSTRWSVNHLPASFTRGGILTWQT